MENNTMTELEKYELINSCESVAELETAIHKMGDITIRKGDVWTADTMCERIQNILQSKSPFNRVTRVYGIRQQLMYLMHYNFID